MGVVLCGHTGSQNHGCEAIIKSTADIFKDKTDVILSTHNIKEDKRFGISEFNKVVRYVNFDYRPVSRLVSIGIDRVFKNKKLANRIRQSPVFHTLRKKSDGNKMVSLNEGGDTYCYGTPYPSIYLNMYCQNHEIPSVLWGCSIEKDAIEEPVILEDLKRYSLIMPRETLTYQYLIEAGISKDRLMLMPDPAFALPIKETAFPKNFIPNNTVGINISHTAVIFNYGDKITIENYKYLINNIINKTDMNVHLIAHH
ncbi:MAG: polysaccharide pyruvyl transferase family protein, partial [Ruminococcus sp.]|nr:polysaccharide pyruvyl transferase family protein [Ruminococcus sp.]